MEKYISGSNQLVLSREEVRAVDSWAINTMGVPGVVLMENAGRSCAEFIIQQLAAVQNPRVCIFCGTGNNGGDGYVIARHLVNAGINTSVVICGKTEKIKGDAKINLDIITKMGLPIDVVDVGDIRITRKIGRAAKGCDMLVDALFGTGLSGKLDENHNTLIETINEQGIPIVAVDIPSGLDCDSGEPLGAAIKAMATVTFVAVKKGFVNPAAAAHTGEVFIASIGIEPSNQKIGNL